MYYVYQAWLYYGEFLALGIWGLMLALVRRILFGGLCKDAALGSNGKGKMQKAMTLKFEKSFEVKVGIYNIPVFVQKYLCQERRFGIPLGRWRRLPERWTGMILGVGFVETMVLRYLGYEEAFYLDRFWAAVTLSVIVGVAILWFESDSLWEQAQVCLLDYVSNTLYPRQVHVYERFGEEAVTENAVSETRSSKEAAAEKAEAEKTKLNSRENSKVKKPDKGVVLKKEEEQVFKEVLSDFLGSST